MSAAHRPGSMGENAGAPAEPGGVAAWSQPSPLDAYRDEYGVSHMPEHLLAWKLASDALTKNGAPLGYQRAGGSAARLSLSTGLLRIGEPVVEGDVTATPVLRISLPGQEHGTSRPPEGPESDISSRAARRAVVGRASALLVECWQVIDPAEGSSVTRWPRGMELYREVRLEPHEAWLRSGNIAPRLDVAPLRRVIPYEAYELVSPFRRTPSEQLENTAGGPRDYAAHLAIIGFLRDL